MRRLAACLLSSSLLFAADSGPLRGYSAESARVQRDWEAKFRAIPDPANLRAYMQRLSARPHHVGSAYDKENAEWILAQVQGVGARRADRDLRRALPYPERARCSRWWSPPASPRSSPSPRWRWTRPPRSSSEQLPTYNAYSIDGDVTAPLVYVNYGMPDDYEELERLGISVKGAIVIARYGGVLARHQA